MAGKAATFYLTDDNRQLMEKTINLCREAGISTAGLRSAIINNGIAISCMEYTRKAEAIRYVK